MLLPSLLLGQEISKSESPFLMVLGIAQDAGFPQISCKKSCCKEVIEGTDSTRFVSCLGLVDPLTNQSWIFDASPDYTFQWQILQENKEYTKQPDGIFLSHAHIGHYTGLMYLGRESMSAKNLPIYCMPKMAEFIKSNGPWSQLVKLENIKIHNLSDQEKIILNERISITPILVPHRDEFSETIGFKIEGPERSILFIPDIDKWHVWEKDIVQLISEVDVAFLDGTFYRNGEIFGRDMSEIPHPFVVETMKLFQSAPPTEKAKVHFIHLNHTNPLINPDSKESTEVLDFGYNIARRCMKFRI